MADSATMHAYEGRPPGLALRVECGQRRALFYPSLLLIKPGRGTRQPECILDNDQWMTARRFHMKYAANPNTGWMHSVCHRGVTIFKLFEEGRVSNSSLTCECDLCLADAKRATTQVYVCGWCDDTFSTKDAYKRHSQTVHQNPAPTSSPKLPAQYVDPARVRHPSQSMPQRARDANLEPEASSSEHNKNVEVIDLDEPEELSRPYEQLLASRAPPIAAVVKELTIDDFSNEEILAKLLERKATFVCKCGIIFRNQTLFFLHRGTHSSQNPYECSFCGHVASDWYDFNSHHYFHSNTSQEI